MKKIIIGLSGLIVLIFLIIFTISAKNDKEITKAKSEVAMDCSKCPSTTLCTSNSSSKTVTCDPAKCSEMKCDPATCKTNCKDASAQLKCDPAKCNQQGLAKK
jgi:hypothetical protein